MQTFYEGFEETMYRPVLLKEMVNAGFIGRMSGRGYVYE